MKIEKPPGDETPDGLPFRCSQLLLAYLLPHEDTGRRDGHLFSNMNYSGNCLPSFRDGNFSLGRRYVLDMGQYLPDLTDAESLYNMSSSSGPY